MFISLVLSAVFPLLPVIVFMQSLEIITVAKDVKFDCGAALVANEAAN